MFRQKSKFPLRMKFVIVATVLAISAIAGLALNRRVFISRPANLQESQPVITTVPLTTALVPADMPVALRDSTATIERDGSRKTEMVSSVNFQAIAVGPEKLTTLNLMVLEFDERGLLRRVDGFIKSVDLTEEKVESFRLPVERRVRLGHKLALAVELAASATRRWEADFDNLTRGVARIVGGNPPGSVTARDVSPVSADTGSALCGNGMRRAMLLAQAGDKTGLTSYTCNQSESSFTFTFNGKNLF